MLLIGSIYLLLIIRGTYDLIENGHKNNCEMTYMYQYPEYIEISLQLSKNEEFNNYKLYVYGEGEYGDSLQMSDFRGIPVLFIPGNKGSYKQVRSLASVSLRKANDEKHSFHFNFFTADLNEEFGALQGNTLERQAQFINKCIDKILSLYDQHNIKHKSIVLFGHSMGGLIAMHVASFRRNKDVSLILTMASPISRPVIIFDRSMHIFYERLHRRWKKKRSSDLKNIVLVSVNGGRNDYQVPPMVTSSPFVDVDASTLSVPSCWLTTDHLAILWCKQLVLACSRALFESVDTSKRMITTDRETIKSAFHYQLIERGYSKHNHFASFQRSFSDFDTNSEWTEIKDSHAFFNLKKSNKHRFYMVSHTYGEFLSILTKDIDWNNWIFACKPIESANKTNICFDGDNLSNYGVNIPGNRREVNILTKEITRKGYSHVVIWIPPKKDEVFFAVHLANKFSVSAVLEAQSIISYFPQVITASTPINSVIYNVTVKGITDLWQSYSVKIQKLHECRKNRLPIMMQKPTWHSRWDVVLPGPTIEDYEIVINAPLQKSKENVSMELHIILDPTCTYNISLENNIGGVFRRLALLYSFQIPTYLTCQLLLILAYQLKALGKGQPCPTVISTVYNLTPIAVIPFIKLGDLAMGYFEIDNDLKLLSRTGNDNAFLPIFMFFITLPVTLLLAGFFWIAIIIWGKSVHNLLITKFRRSLRTTGIVTELAVESVTRIPCIIAIALTAFLLVTNAGLAIGIACLVYFALIFKMHQTYLEDLILRIIPLKQSKEDTFSHINLHMTLFHLILVQFALNVPSLIIWLQNPQLIQLNDEEFVGGSSSLLMLGFIWQINLIKPRKFYNITGAIIHGLAILCVMFGSVNLYNLKTIIVLSILVVLIHHRFAPNLKTECIIETGVDAVIDESTLNSEEDDIQENIPYSSGISQDNSEESDVQIGSDDNEYDERIDNENKSDERINDKKEG